MLGAGVTSAGLAPHGALGLLGKTDIDDRAQRLVKGKQKLQYSHGEMFTPDRTPGTHGSFANKSQADPWDKVAWQEIVWRRASEMQGNTDAEKF